MTCACWQPGRRLHTSAAVLTILSGLAHTAGNMASGPPLPGEREAFAAMEAFHVDMGMGMVPSLGDIYWVLVWIMSVTFLALGAINVMLAAHRETPAGVLRSAAWINVTWAGVGAILCFQYHVPPPMICCALIAVVSAVEAVTSPRSTNP